MGFDKLLESLLEHIMKKCTAEIIGVVVSLELPNNGKSVYVPDEYLHVLFKIKGISGVNLNPDGCIIIDIDIPNKSDEIINKAVIAMNNLLDK
jgi:hypothetical protein